MVEVQIPTVALGAPPGQTKRLFLTTGSGSYVERTLWRCRAIATDRLQLTFTPMQVGAPHWSRDGKWIAFLGESPAKGIKGYTASVNGGLAEPVWPKLKPAKNVELVSGWRSDHVHTGFCVGRVRTLNLNAHEIKDVPGSVGLTGAVWSPDGCYAVAENTAFGIEAV